MENIPIKDVDVATLGGLALVLPMIVGGIKILWTDWVKGKEPTLCFGLSYLIGVAVKLTVPGAYESLGWVALLVSLFFIAVLAQVTHDKFVNIVLKKKEKGGGA